MFAELPKTLIVVIAGAFVLGWLLSYVSYRLGSKLRVQKRDPRDDRIRSLEAELRIALSDREKSHEQVEEMEEQLKETAVGIERRDTVISAQQSKLEGVTRDLKESVMKTRELRAELASRAVENVQAEAKIREVETELSVAHASTDMLATGVLGLTDEDMADIVEDTDEPEASKSAG